MRNAIVRNEYGKRWPPIVELFTNPNLLKILLTKNFVKITNKPLLFKQVVQFPSSEGREAKNGGV